MTLTRLFVDAGTVSADRNGFSAVALGWCHEADAAMTAGARARAVAVMAASRISKAL
jgi:hypothetical protein